MTTIIMRMIDFRQQINICKSQDAIICTSLKAISSCYMITTYIYLHTYNNCTEYSTPQLRRHYSKQTRQVYQLNETAPLALGPSANNYASQSGTRRSTTITHYPNLSSLLFFRQSFSSCFTFLSLPRIIPHCTDHHRRSVTGQLFKWSHSHIGSPNPTNK